MTEAGRCDQRRIVPARHVNGEIRLGSNFRLTQPALPVCAVLIFGPPLAIVVGCRWQFRGPVFLRARDGHNRTAEGKTGSHFCGKARPHRVGDNARIKKDRCGGRGEGQMGVEWIAIGGVLAAGALFVGFPFGVAVGYAWRDSISRSRRLRVKQELRRAELEGAAAAFAPPDIKLAGRLGKFHVGRPVDDVAAASDLSAPAAGEPSTARPTVKRATGSNKAIAMRNGRDRKRRKVPEKTKLKVVTTEVLQEPGPGRTSREQKGFEQN
jgi:hypothetical protein